MSGGRIRIGVALLVGVALLSAACGQEGPTGEGPGPPTLEEGILQVGSCLDYPPFESVKQGDETGFDVDLTEAIAQKLGLEVEWVRADFDTIFTATEAGQFDMAAAAITATGKLGKERDDTVDFSDFYFNSLQSLAVNVQESPDIDSTDDLGSGDVVGVQKGTTGKDWAEQNLEPQGVEIRTYSLAPQAFGDLETGRIVGVINDQPASVGIIEAQQLTGTVEVVQPIDTNEKYAFAFSPDNPELREAVNGALQEVIADGTYQEIWGKYFEGDPPPEFQPSA